MSEIYDFTNHKEKSDRDKLTKNSPVINFSTKDDYSHIENGSYHLFKYLDHKTTFEGRVALEFISLDGTFPATMFCNAATESPKGTKYEVGLRGQFIPPTGRKGKFVKLWMIAVGKKPIRWCTVHKNIRSGFKDLIFEFKVEHDTASSGEHYIKITSDFYDGI